MNTEFVIVHDRIEENGILTIFRPVGLQYSGIYTCVIKDSGNSTASRVFAVSVQGILIMIFTLDLIFFLANILGTSFQKQMVNFHFYSFFVSSFIKTYL